MNKKYIKISKIFIILYIVTGISSLSIFIPQIRDFIILLGEKYIGRALTHDVWHERFLNWECKLLFLILMIPVFVKAGMFIFLRIKDFMTLPDKTIYSYIDSKAKNITTDDWLHYIPLAIFIIILCIIHFFMIETGDDCYFSSLLKVDSPFINYNFLKKRYNDWSSRLIIETILINCYRLNFGVWRILDVTAFVLIAECLISICFSQKNMPHWYIQLFCCVQIIILCILQDGVLQL